MEKWWPLWVMLWLAILLILCGFITVFNPWKFWWIINILLWISLLLSGIAAITNAIRNQKAQYISFLFVIWILAVMLWIILIWSREVNLVWKLMVWMFALWAFMRGGMLIFFWIQNKENLPLWRWICVLWWILVLLAILTALSAAVMTDIIGIFIGISIIFDGLALLFFSLKWGNTQVIQAQIISQADENEIAQWDVVITETVITNDPHNTQH